MVKKADSSLTTIPALHYINRPGCARKRKMHRMRMILSKTIRAQVGQTHKALSFSLDIQVVIVPVKKEVLELERFFIAQCSFRY
jgi:hypothetical protein